ncbi:MAG: glycerol acyltransferase [Legionellales bacterium RIFCSPHIGHO2_12_FULL_35_11]|nr:MAG: glycerol acyltransferase [Legionellales bacterium RIFCSPHIGHO2_12_FULL_35_11]
MQTGKIRSFKIITLSLLFTAYTCGRAIIKSMLRNISRKWCDEELQRWVNRLKNLLDIKLKIYNPHKVEPQPGQATILMCNHSSLFDIPLSLLAFPNHSVRMLSKKQIANIPIMGGGMIAAEFPLIDRENRKQAIRDLKVVEDLLKTGIVMWIAPEGTRSADGKLGKFKKGGFITAISTKATIIPMGIRGVSNILPARTKNFNLGQNAEIHIGKPINAGKYQLSQKDELSREVYAAIQELLGVSRAYA